MLIVVAGEPSPPKLESNLQPKGNSVKVNLIKQDDGGSPITHYLIRYKAVSVITHILRHYNVYITTSFNLLLYLNKKTDPAFECPFCPFLHENTSVDILWELEQSKKTNNQHI